MARGRGRMGGPRRGGRGRGRGVGNFLAPRTGRQAGAIANAMAGAEYNPEIRQLRQEAKGSRQRQRDLGQWYAQLAKDYNAAQQAGFAALQSVQDTTSRQLAEAAERSSADQARLAAEDEEFAKLVGGPRDTAGLAKIAQAAAAAEQSRVALNQPVAQEQANFIARLGGERTAARLQGIEARQSEEARRRKLREDLAAARKEKGFARASRKEEIRQADRDYDLNLKKFRQQKLEAQQAAQQAALEAELDQMEAQRQAEQDAIDAQLAQERIGVSRRQANISGRNARIAEERAAEAARHNRVTERNQRNSGGMSPAERRKRRERAADAMSAARALLRIEVPKNRREWGQFQQALVEQLGSSYSAEATRAVAKLRRQLAAKRRKAYQRRRRAAENILNPEIVRR